MFLRSAASGRTLRSNGVRFHRLQQIISGPSLSPQVETGLSALERENGSEPLVPNQEQVKIQVLHRHRLGARKPHFFWPELYRSCTGLSERLENNFRIVAIRDLSNGP